MPDARRTLQRSVTEDQWEATVVDAAVALGWKVAGFRSAQLADGHYETPVRHDGKGWPDLLLARDRLIVVELKTERGQLRPDQREWLHRLEVAGVEAYCWRPRDWDEALEVLRRRVDR